MAVGAVSLALRTPAMARHFDPGHHFLGYGRDLDGLESTLVTARERPERLQAIADAGHRKVREEFGNLHNVKLLFEPVLDIGDPAMTGALPGTAQRSEESRVGKEMVSKCKSRWGPVH